MLLWQIHYLLLKTDFNSADFILLTLSFNKVICLQIDKELWLRIGEGDQQAYALVYRFYYKRFYNYGRKFTDNESLIEDVIQKITIQFTVFIFYLLSMQLRAW